MQRYSTSPQAVGHPMLPDAPSAMQPDSNLPTKFLFKGARMVREMSCC